MFGLGLPDLLFIAMVLIIVMGVALIRRGGSGIRISGPTLVLRKFIVNETPSDSMFIYIEGRKSGLIAWLLTLAGIDEDTILQASDREVIFKSSSLFGSLHHVVPLPSISSAHCGYSNPMGYIILAVIFIIVGLWGAFLTFASYDTLWDLGMVHDPFPQLRILILGLVIGIVFLIVYWLSRKITMVIETSGGMTLGLNFKRSVIENVPVNIDKTLNAVSILNKKVVESQLKQEIMRGAQNE